MNQANSSLVISDLSKSFTVNCDEINVLKNINLGIKKGEFISIVGHSGCGKSTLLKIIAGLIDYHVGVVSIDGNQIRSPGKERGMVFQDHRLLPWLTIKDNVTLGLYNLTKKEKENIVQQYLELVGLKGFANAYPHQLSGGMAQRAAIARALVKNPQVLLLDEPFGALDALTRLQMQKEILRIWGQEKNTMILVTHDIDEAIFLSDRVVIMSSRPGKIKKIIPVELGRPRDRSSYDFSLLRREIYQEFFSDQQDYIDYCI